MKKKLLKGLSVLLSTVCCASLFAGCSDNVVSNPQTASVYVYRAGFGSTWLENAAKRFNEIYTDEGYTVIIEEETVGDPLNNISVPRRNKTDLFFAPQSVVNKNIDASRSVLGSNDEVLLEDLSGLLNSKALNANKEEEGEETILGRMNEDYFKPYLTYTGNLTQWQGKYYAFPWANSPCGLFVNVKALEEATGSSELPNTTDDLIGVIESVYQKNQAGQTDIKPVVWAGKEARVYWSYMFYTLQAQYSGVKTYNNFFDFIPETGTTVANGYDVYDDPAILEALKVMEKIVVDDYAPANTTTADIMAAQANLYRGDAIFMVSGNWLYNEMVHDYGQYMDDVVMMRMPVISSLGTKLGIGNDDTLSAIVAAIDADEKTDAQIASEFGVDETDVKEIRTARGIYFNLAMNFCAVIPSYADGKEVAKLFLRFLASQEGMEIYRNGTNSDLPFDYITEKPASEEPFFESIDAVTQASNSVMIDQDLLTSPIRRVAGIQGFCKEGGDAYVWPKFASGSLNAQDVYGEQLAWAKENWGFWLRTAGLTS